MTSALFSCRANAHSYTITEYSEALEPMAAYEITWLHDKYNMACNCGANIISGVCQHRRMLPLFLQHSFQSEPWLIAYDRFTGWYESRQYVGPLKEFVAEENCPGHVASAHDPKICARCNTHIDSLRPEDDLL